MTAHCGSACYCFLFESTKIQECIRHINSATYGESRGNKVISCQVKIMLNLKYKFATVSYMLTYSLR